MGTGKLLFFVPLNDKRHFISTLLYSTLLYSTLLYSTVLLLTVSCSGAHAELISSDPSSGSVQSAAFSGCGGYCLAWLAENERITLSDSQSAILERACTQSSMTLAQLRKDAELIGFPGRTVQIDAAPDDSLPLPLIFLSTSRHYMVLIRQEPSSGSWLVFDPARSREIWLDRATLLRQWSGYAFVPDSRPEQERNQ